MTPFDTLTDTQFRDLFPIFDGLLLTEVTRLRSLMSESSYKRREVLMKQGAQGDQVLFLTQGRIKVVTSSGVTKSKPKTGSNLAQAVVSFCVQGEVLGEINALTSGGHSASVIAEEACFAWSMAVDDFLQSLADMPRLQLNISRLLAQRTRKATEQLHVMATMPAEQRVAYNLTLIIEQAGTNGSLVNGSPANGSAANSQATPSVTIADLSSMCGCSSKHVRRVLTKLHEAGLIEQTEGQVHILDPEGLKACAPEI